MRTLSEIIELEEQRQTQEQTAEFLWKVARLLTTSTEFVSLSANERSDIIFGLQKLSEFKKELVETSETYS